jgi:hypothetical protein
MNHINAIRVKRMLLECAYHTTPRDREYALSKWWDKHVLEFGQELIQTQQEIEHTKDAKSLFEHRTRNAAFQIAEAAVEKKALGIEDATYELDVCKGIGKRTRFVLHTLVDLDWEMK